MPCLELLMKKVALGPAILVDDSVSIVCDPRNVLPLRAVAP